MAQSPAQEARALVAAEAAASLATLGEAGDPWASFVTYAALADGSPALLLSTLAEHGRNLERDPRASLLVVEPDADGDPLERGRVTLAGRAERPDAVEAGAARAAILAAIPVAATYVDFADFSLWVLRVERLRWVGGYGRMASVEAADYRAAWARAGGS
jgi:putative heme iron utilization protein